MERSRYDWRYFAAFACGLALFLVAQAGVMKVVLKHPGKGESNFFSSLARVQNAAKSPGRIAFVGSSVTGRLPDRNSGVPDVVNLGVDGGSAIDGLQAIDRGIVNVTGQLVVEVNTLRVGLHAADVKVVSHLTDPWFQAGLKVPQLSYAARPSSMVYAWARRLRSLPSPASNVLKSGFSGPVIPKPDGPAVVFPADEMARLEEIVSIISKAKGRGLNVTFVLYPPKWEQTPVEMIMAREIARRCQIFIWDLGSDVNPEALAFSDRIHLDPASASAVSAVILREIEGKTAPR